MRAWKLALSQWVAIALIFAPFDGAVAQTIPKLITMPAGVAEVIRLDRGAALIIVGDPKVAQVTTGISSSQLVVTGITPGRTNLIAIDNEGIEIISRTVYIKAGNEVSVRIYKGTPSSEQELCNVSSCWPSAQTTVSERVVPQQIQQVPSQP